MLYVRGKAGDSVLLHWGQGNYHSMGWCVLIVLVSPLLPQGLPECRGPEAGAGQEDTEMKPRGRRVLSGGKVLRLGRNAST